MAGSAAEAAAGRLRALDCWRGPPVIAPWPGGRTNQNFRVESGGRTYFARVGIDLPHHFVRRSNEARCARLAAASGAAPPVVYDADGILVTEFVAGRTLSHTEPVDDATLDLVADALRLVHAHPAPADLNRFDPVAICRGNLAGLPRRVMTPARWRLLESVLDAAPLLRARCLIHADLIPENFIVADGRACIVDWEYAGYGDPAVDLAQIDVLFRLDGRRTARLLGRHGGVDIATVRALRPVLAAREVLWCEVQAHHVGISGDLPEYRQLCWQRLEEIGPGETGA
ncbi:MAG: phosphotransferase family protein [Alphaproteobacteria bacterium]|nr:phosphotransferase family protein [Alphaproteobacteria bacterium]